MNKFKNNESGFSVVEIVMVIVIVGLIGAVGYLVYKNQHKTTKTVVVTKVVKAPSQSNPSTDITKNWIKYKSTDGGFSFKYPKEWVTSANMTGCPSGLLMLGANSNSIGQCGGNNFGQMTVTWQPVKAQCGLGTSVWTINSTKNVTVSGVSGLETNATSKVVTASGPTGTSTIQYCFITNSTMYIANYTVLSGYPNVLSDFNTMVTKTFSFTN